MIDFFNWIWHSTVAMVGLGGALVAVCGVIAWYVPPLRRLAIMAGGAILAVLFAYAKGAADRGKEDKERSDAAVKKINEKYSEIDARSDNPGSVDSKLRNGKF